MLTELKEAKRGYDELYRKVEWEATPWGLPPIFASFRIEIVKQEIVDHIPATSKRVLDAACGYGVLVDFLVRAGKLREYVGLDISSKMLKMAKAKLSDLPVEFVLGVGEFLPFKQGSFDVVVCAETLEHVVDKKKVINEISKTIKPRGLVIITTPRREWVKSWQKYFPLTFLLGILIKAKRRALTPAPKGVRDVYSSSKELRRLVISSSLKILKHQYIAFFPPFHTLIPYTTYIISLYKRLSQINKLQNLRRVQLLVATK